MVRGGTTGRRLRALLSRGRAARRRFRTWATIDKTGKIFDLVFKAGVIAIALTYLFRPDVHAGLPMPTAVFIDEDVLHQRYQDSFVPTVVIMVAHEYNMRNELDIKQNTNSTLSQLPLSALCENVNITTMLKKLYGKACGESKLKKGRYYERYLFVLNECFRSGEKTVAVGGEIIRCDTPGESLNQKDLKRAMDNLHAAEYRRAELSIENGGTVRADHVHVVIAPQYTFSALHRVHGRTADSPIDSAKASPLDRTKDQEVRSNDFPLEPNEHLLLAYTTARGSADPQTEEQFELDWKGPDRSDFPDLITHSAWPIRIVVGALVLTFILFFISSLHQDYKDSASPSSGP